MAAESGYMKTSTMGTVVVDNGAGVSLTFLYDRGDVSVGPLSHRLNEHKIIQRRGKPVSNAYGDATFPNFNFSCFVGNIIGSTGVAPGTPAEMFTALGAYSGNGSVAGTGRPTTVNITLTMSGVPFGDAANETLKGTNVFVTMQFAESMDGNTLSLTGTVITSVTAVNGSNTVVFQHIP